MKQADCPRCGGAGFALVPKAPQISTVKQHFAPEPCPDCDGTGIDPFVMRVFRDQATIALAASSSYHDETLQVICSDADALTAARYPRKAAP